MKNLKKIAAVVLAATMAVNVAGCAMGGKLSPSAIIVIKDGYSQIINVNQDKGTLGTVYLSKTVFLF